MNPVPSKYSAESLKRPSALPTPDAPPRKLPKQRGVQPDQLEDFNRVEMIQNFEMLYE